MNTKALNIIAISIVIASFLASILVLPDLPRQIATYWSADGVPNGYTDASMGVFILPIIMLVLSLLYWAIPKLDPLKYNIKSFRKYYDLFWASIIAFLGYLHALMLVWNLGNTFDLVLFVLPAIAVFWYFIGILLENSKRNWFIGIRTPWTLSSDTVWERTHQIGGKLFKITAPVFLLGMFFGGGDLAFVLLLVSAVFIALFITIYSYTEYKKLKK